MIVSELSSHLSNWVFFARAYVMEPNHTLGTGAPSWLNASIATPPTATGATTRKHVKRQALDMYDTQSRDGSGCALRSHRMGRDMNVHSDSVRELTKATRGAGMTACRSTACRQPATIHHTPLLHARSASRRSTSTPRARAILFPPTAPRITHGTSSSSHSRRSRSR